MFAQWITEDFDEIGPTCSIIPPKIGERNRQAISSFGPRLTTPRIL